MSVESHLTTRQKEPTAEPHPFSVSDLRLYAYAKKFGEGIPIELAEHLAHCTECEFWLKILHRTDPVLNGEDEVRVKQLIRTAESKEKEIPTPALLTAQAAAGLSASKAMCVFSTTLWQSDKTRRGTRPVTGCGRQSERGCCVRLGWRWFDRVPLAWE